MNFSFFIARRYLFSKNNRNAINIISGISVTVVAVATAALIIVLSSVNGFGLLIDEQISSYAPDFKIEAKKGKVFNTQDAKFKKIKNLKGVRYFAEISEANVLLKYDDKQTICTVKGIPDDYENYFHLSDALKEGIFQTKGKNLNYVILGGGIAYKLGIYIQTGKSVSLWTPNRKKVNILNPEQAFNIINLIPSGIIAIDNEFDLKYILTSNKVVKKITDRKPYETSYIEILVNNQEQLKTIKSQAEKILGNDFLVKDKYEQFDVYRVMKSERLAAFIIMLFITLIASFSIIGSVMMLIIEKKTDIFTIMSMGATLKTVRRIFFLEGWLISISGAFAGVLIGGLICLAQQKFGFVTFPSDGMYIVDSYPIDMKISDFLLTFFSVAVLGTLISWYPTSKLNKEFINSAKKV